MEWLNDFFSVKKGDITIKWVCDHIKNYMVCGALWVAGWTLPSFHWNGPFWSIQATICAYFLMALAFILSVSNLIHGIIAAAKSTGPSRITTAAFAVTFLISLITINMIAVASVAGR